METIKLTRGSAVSIDAIGFTKLVKAISETGKESSHYRIYKIVDRMHKAIKYALGSTNGKVVHYTGDGALIFFEDIYEMTSTEQAVRFGMAFSCMWRRWKTIFNDLKFSDLNGIDEDLNFRIAIDYGDVVMRDDGGLWSGLVLNHACKIRLKGNDKNRVIITQKVMEVLPEESLYKHIFKAIPNTNIEEDCGVGGLYGTCLSDHRISMDNSTTNTIFEPGYSCLEKKLNWIVCISGIYKEKYQIEIVLKSINLQSYQPKCVVIVGEKKILDSVSLKGLQFKTVLRYMDTLKNTNRAGVRNYLQHYAITSEEKYDVICFLDGDTLIKQDVFKNVYNIFCTNRDCMISAERIDFDDSLNELEALSFSGEFLKNETVSYGWNSRLFSLFYNQERKKGNISASGTCKFLPSYILFVPTHIVRKVGDWDENFKGWGEEDIDYTFRAYKMGYSLIIPLLPNHMTMHLSHKIGDSSSLLMNAQYLLSKYPDLRDDRIGFYEAIGL